VEIRNPHLESHLEDERLVAPFQPSDRRRITCYDPATALHLNTVVADNGEEIRAKIEAADLAQKRWRRTTLAQRRKVIRSLKKWLIDNQESCVKVACRDTGKTSECTDTYVDCTEGIAQCLTLPSERF
jgi:acyl-CoA reductase-like NAD-dependent aldehyde dehydrogenase